jgi:hypothetical protein
MCHAPFPLNSNHLRKPANPPTAFAAVRPGQFFLNRELARIKKNILSS